MNTRFSYAQRFDDADGIPEGAEYVGRVDAVQELPEPEWTPEGYLKTKAFTARPGIYVYKQDGREVRELVPRSTLADAEANATLAMKPVTLGHPPAMLTKETAADYSIGTTGETVSVRADGRPETSIMVTDGDALSTVKKWRADGKPLGTSPGYNVKLDETPGKDAEYGAYDRIQVKRVYNHLALTPSPRGGAGVHFRMDGVPELTEPAAENTENDDMKLIDALIELGYSRADAETLADLDKGKALLEKAEKFDALPEPDPEGEKAARVAERKERRELLEVATGLELKMDDLDGLDNVDIKRSIMTAAGAPEVKLDGVDDDVATGVRYDAFLAFRKDSADDEPEQPGVRYDHSDNDDVDITAAWGRRK